MTPAHCRVQSTRWCLLVGGIAQQAWAHLLCIPVPQRSDLEAIEPRAPGLRDDAAQREEARQGSGPALHFCHVPPADGSPPEGFLHAHKPSVVGLNILLALVSSSNMLIHLLNTDMLGLEAVKLSAGACLFSKGPLDNWASGLIGDPCR